MSAIADALRDGDAAARSDACRRASRDPAAAFFVEALAAALGDAAPGVRRAAADALVAIAAAGGGALPAGDATRRSVERALAGALRGARGPARIAAVRALARLAPPDPGWLPACVDALGDADGESRWLAVRTIVAIGRAEPSATAVVAALARGDDANGVARAAGNAAAGDAPSAAARRMALFAWAELAPDDAALPETVRARLAARAGDAAERRAAATVAARIDDPPAALIDALLAVAEEPGERDDALRARAALALAAIAARRAELRPHIADRLARAASRDRTGVLASAAARAKGVTRGTGA